MSASTMTKLGPEMTMALEIAEAGKSDPRKAESMATRAARRYPDFKLPAGNGREITFGQLQEHFASLTAAVAPVVTRVESAPPAAPKKATTSKSTTSKSTTSKSTASKSTTARKAAPVKAAPAPVSAVLTVLQLVHDGVSQTALFGVEKGSPAHLAIGSAKKGGLGWWFYRENESFYVPGSQGYAPDMAKIDEAVARLESLTGESGEQLYRVEKTIMLTVDGKALPVRKSRDEMREWQRAYTTAQNLHTFAINMGNADCGTCGAKGLGESAARIVKGADGMPTVQCATCGGFAAPAPVVRVPVTLALPAAPVKAEVSQPEKAECPKCKTMQLVKGGKLGLHSANGQACRGKLGVTVVDVEPEAAQAPARARKAARKAAPEAESVVLTGLMVTVQIQRALSKSKQGDVATWMRQAIAKRITNGHRGMDVELRRDKNTGVATITVIDAAGYVGDLDKAIMAAVSAVPGFGNRINR